jgi:DNA mismatch endonuclease, patch repair protein
MVDIVDKHTRSRMMSGIRGKNTKPELFIRSQLHLLGFRFRIHYTKLPGKPDIALPKYRALILVHGCFWHGHDCHLFKWPKSNRRFWRDKIESNIQRDADHRKYYADAGWRTLVVWECALKGAGRMAPEELMYEVRDWVLNNCEDGSLSATRRPPQAPPGTTPRPHHDRHVQRPRKTAPAKNP